MMVALYQDVLPPSVASFAQVGQSPLSIVSRSYSQKLPLGLRLAEPAILLCVCVFLQDWQLPDLPDQGASIRQLSGYNIAASGYVNLRVPLPAGSAHGTTAIRLNGYTQCLSGYNLNLYSSLYGTFGILNYWIG